MNRHILLLALVVVFCVGITSHPVNMQSNTHPRSNKPPIGYREPGKKNFIGVGKPRPNRPVSGGVSGKASKPANTPNNGPSVSRPNRKPAIIRKPGGATGVIPGRPNNRVPRPPKNPGKKPQKCNTSPKLSSQSSKYIAEPRKAKKTTIPFSGHAAHTGIDHDCDHEADIVFVLDSSGSISSDTWDDIKQWVHKSVEALHGVGVKTQVGLVTFDTDVHHDIKVPLTDHKTHQDFIRIVDNLPQKKGGTRIDLGMEEALNLFTAGRPHLHKTVILLTDGQGSNRPLSEVGEDFHKKHIRVIAVGVGTGVREADLISMTKDNGKGSNTHDHYFDASHGDELASDDFISNTIEGCNFAFDCHSVDTELVGGKLQNKATANSFGECADLCSKHSEEMTRLGFGSQKACRYFSWYSHSYGNVPKAKRGSKRGQCFYYSSSHCGYMGASCKQKAAVGVESGSVNSCKSLLAAWRAAGEDTSTSGQRVPTRNCKPSLTVG